MKAFIQLSGIFLLLFIFGCNEDPISNDRSGKGKILLKIDSENAPQDVSFVRAYLTRDNYQTITGSLTLQSDSTADLLLDNIAAGVWHLKVDAEDADGIVLYTGETDVEILADFISQVYLTLNPTGSGTGSIYIFVNWGLPQNSLWIDYDGNPLIAYTNNYYDPYGASQPVVLFDGGIYKMWYAGIAASSRMYVLYAESNDGINWNLHPDNPVLAPGEYGSWDSLSVSPATIIKDAGIYMMYYSGWDNELDNWHIGLAKSADGINWDKSPDPVLYGTAGWEYQIIASGAVKFNNQYLLYYTGRNFPEYKIGVAISEDGTNFSRYQGNPILVNDEPWEQSGVYDGSVIIENGLLKMVFMNSAATGFGTAFSSDGFNWTKNEANPFITNDNTANNWADIKISYPYLIKTDTEYRIYYAGSGSASYYHRIGMMKKSF